MDFKETGEVCALLEGSAKALEQVRADNKLGLDDLFAVSPLIDLGKDAITDVQKILSEFKEANGEELEEMISRLVHANLAFVREVSATIKMIIKK